MERALEVWMSPIWVGDSSWLTLAALRALIVCFAILVLAKGAQRLSSNTSYIAFMLGTLVVAVAFSMNMTQSILIEAHPMLTWNSLFIDVGLIYLLLGALLADNRIREEQGLEPIGPRGLTNLQRRASLVAGILICVFTVSIDEIQLVFGILGVGLMFIYLLPSEDGHT